MRVQPRHQLLEIWEATARASWINDQWVPGGRYGTNPISDAEQLLCLLLPATQIEAFGLDRPDQTAGRMVKALRVMGTATDLPRSIIRILTDYYIRYTEDGSPVFAGGGYYEERDRREDPPKERTALPIVDSYALSITLSLATLGFTRVFRRSVTREAVRESIRELERLASIRLSAAMVGLLRSFSVNVFPVDSPEGKRLCTTVNQSGLPTRSVVNQLHTRLRQTMASFREVLIGSGQSSDLESPDRLFECGWSWGVVRQAPEVETPESEVIGRQPAGFAEDKPYLYFTVVALNAVEALYSERTRILGLLNEEQQRLARALQLRSDLTRSYWTTVATFGEGDRWPVENIPWRTTDGEESDYFTLQVTSLAIQGLSRVRGSDAELARVGRVLATLAERARITSRAVQNDNAVQLHYPGVRLALNGSEAISDTGEMELPPDGGAPAAWNAERTLYWSVPEFSALLLRRTTGVAELITDPDERTTVLELCDEIWEHLVRRQVASGPSRGLWDAPVRIYERLDRIETGPSWYYTERVVEALVAIVNVLDRPPLRNEKLFEYAQDLVREAEQIFDRELLYGGAEAGPQLAEKLRTVDVTIRRAREIITERPGTAVALACEVLRELDRLEAARKDVSTEA